MDCSPPGSSVCGIFQTRILEWVAISFSSISLLPPYPPRPASPNFLSFLSLEAHQTSPLKLSLSKLELRTLLNHSKFPIPRGQMSSLGLHGLSQGNSILIDLGRSSVLYPRFASLAPPAGQSVHVLVSDKSGLTLD